MSQNTAWLSVMQWIARALGSAIFALVMFIFAAHLVEDGLPTAYTLTPAESWMFVGMFVMVFGALLGWWRELLAGLMLIGGYVLFVGVQFVRNGTINVGAVIPIFPVIGLLYLICWWGTRRQGTDVTFL